MIRVATILCKFNSINLSDKQLFESMNSFRRLSANTACPHCGSTYPLAFHSCYERSLIHVSEGMRINDTVTISRGKCSCGKTHALLEDLLIPYGSYSIRFVFTVLWEYLNRTSTVASLCENFQISISTLYGWIHSFEEQYNLWVGILKEISALTASALADFMSIEMLPSLFFKRFRFSLFQNIRTTFSGP